MSATATSRSPKAWTPTQAEVAAIVLEMRPIIDRFVARDQRLLQRHRI